MKLFKIIAFSLLAAFSLPVIGAYPGNPNFRDVSVIYTATTRTDWITNVTTIVSQSTNPGYAASIDWDRYAKPIAPGVDHIPTVLTKEGGWPTNMACHMLRINLTTPGLRFTGTDRCPEGWGEDMPESISKKNSTTYYKKRTVREKTSDFLARNRGAKSKGGKERDARIAFNLAAWLPWTTPYTNLWAETYSPLYSDGKSVSFSSFGGVQNAAGDNVSDAMIVIYKDGTAELTHYLSEQDAKRVWFCAPAFVAEMVSAGQIPTHANGMDPRTALGISQDNKTLYLFICDGRREGWSGGCYWHSLSTLLLAMGSYYAINLDGGGSTTLCVWDETSGKPMVLNRPAGGLRDNGSNAAIYYKMPDAMLGTFYYDDFDFMIQDIIDGETDGSSEINVLGDATFTAEHPYIPSGRYNIWSTNNASIGWADGVTPQLAAGTIVRFRNIRFREGSRTLSVPAGATAVFNDGVDIDEVDIAQVGGLVIGGTPACQVRVSCAAAPGVGQVFATSVIPLADSIAAAKKFTCATDDSLAAEAFEEWGVVKFRWSKIVTFGAVTGNMAGLGHGVVNVTVDSSASEYATGYQLKFTVKSEDGLRTATKTIDFAGAGDYSFDTLDTSDPTICGSGYGFDFTVELVDAGGAHVPNSAVVSGSMGLGVAKDWFSASASDDSAAGGAWTAKPAIAEGRYAVSDAAALNFAATESKDGRVRYETDVEFYGFISDAYAQQMLESVKTAYSMPHGACFVARGADGLPVWRGLVSENNAPAFRTLYGPAALNTPTKVFCDVDWSSGAPRVRYSVAVGDGAETVLADEAGNAWFAGASSANAAAGRVLVSGFGSVASLAGRFVARVLAVEGGYAAWIAEKGISGEPGDTATNEIPNAVRYAFDIDPSKGPSEMGEPIIKVVFDENGKPCVRSRDLAEGRDDVTFGILATENLNDWSSATLVPMEKFESDGLWKPAASEDSLYVFPSQMFFKYIIDVR